MTDTTERPGGAWGVVTALLEQGVSSGGSFAFFFVMARWLGPEQFGLFSCLWLGVLATQAVLTQWVYLPLGSLAVDAAEEAALRRVMRRRLVATLLPGGLGAAAVAALVLPSDQLAPAALAWVVPATWAAGGVEYLRCLLIRLRASRAASLVSAARWTITLFGVAAAGMTERLDAASGLAATTAGAAAAVALGVALRRPSEAPASGADDEGELARRATELARPLLVYGLVTLVSGLLTAKVIAAWVSLVAYGALQGARALCNVLSVPMQAVDTHFANHLARQPRVTSGVARLHYLIAALGALLTLALVPGQEAILRGLLGEPFVEFAPLLPIVFASNVLLLANRVQAAVLRRLDATRPFLLGAALAALGAVVLVPAAMAGVGVIGLALILAVVPLLQLLAFDVSLRWALGAE